jgi:hypothetical protein
MKLPAIIMSCTMRVITAVGRVSQYLQHKRYLFNIAWGTTPILETIMASQSSSAAYTGATATRIKLPLLPCYQLLLNVGRTAQALLSVKHLLMASGS